MHRWVVRGLLFGLLLASVFSGEVLHRRADLGANIEATIKYLLAHEGLAYRETKSFSGESLNVMMFNWPACGEPLQVAATPRTFDAVALFKRMGAPGDIRLLAYLSNASEHETRYSLFLEHFKYSVLGLIGMTSYEPDGTMLMVVVPSGCTLAPPVDWSLVWQTNYRLKVAKSLKPIAADDDRRLGGV